MNMQRRAAYAYAKPPARRPGLSTAQIAAIERDFDPDGKNCMSRGGSFASPTVTADLKQSGMRREGTTVEGIKMWATQAQLDAMVNGAVFAPYLAGGFQIDCKGAHP